MTFSRSVKIWLSALAVTSLATHAQSLSCEIVFHKDGEYVTLEAIASNHGPVQGNYVLGVTTISGSNSSTSMQSGPVVIEGPANRIILARSVLRMTPQTRVTAQVTIETAQARTRCRTEAPQDIQQGEDI